MPLDRSTDPVARALELRDAINQALTGPGPLKAFEGELRRWANGQVREARAAQQGSPAIAESRPPRSFFRDFFGDDAEAIAEELREGA